jgi:transcriptional regulator with XRE-family HTH domain
MKITGWAETVLDLLRAANVRQTQLADRLKMDLPTLHRYLHGDRRPDQEKISKINRAVAKLVGRPIVGPFLDSEAMLSGLLDPSQRIVVELVDEGGRRMYDDGDTVLSADYSMNIDALVRATLAQLDRYGHPYLSAGYRECVETYMRTGGEATARRFAVELNRVFQHILIAELRPPSAPVGFNAICEVLQRHGIAVDVTEFGSFIIGWEHVQWVVRRELARANPGAPASERLAAEKRIFDAFREHSEPRHTPRPPTDCVITPLKPRRKRGNP